MLAFAVATGVIVGLSAWCLARIRREYRSEETLSTLSVVGVWTLYLFHFSTTVAAATLKVWTMPLDTVVSSGVGLVLLCVGAVLFVFGIWSFHSFRRMSGLDTGTLVTGGIYRWSRNPQNVGWAAFLLGLALVGKSGLALALTALFWIVFVSYVRLEERFLEGIFGDRYREYVRWTHRYFGAPKNT